MWRLSTFQASLPPFTFEGQYWSIHTLADADPSFLSQPLAEARSSSVWNGERWWLAVKQRRRQAQRISITQLRQDEAVHPHAPYSLPPFLHSGPSQILNNGTDELLMLWCLVTQVAEFNARITYELPQTYNTSREIVVDGMQRLHMNGLPLAVWVASLPMGWERWIGVCALRTIFHCQKTNWMRSLRVGIYEI